MYISISQKIKVPHLLMAHLHAFKMACRLDLEKNTLPQIITHAHISHQEDPDP